MDTIITHLQDNAAVYAVGALSAIVITIAFRRWVIPFLYHTAEYAIYCGLAHFLLGGFVRAFSWFREETEFKSYSGKIDPNWDPYTTPLNFNFWQRELYSPAWLFWFEVAIAVGLLYVVIVIRPTRLKHKPVESKRPKPGARSGNGPSESYMERMRSAGRMKSAK